MPVPELHDLETTTVDVEMNVAFLKIGRDGFPDMNLWMEFLNGFPCGLSEAVAVFAGVPVLARTVYWKTLPCFTSIAMFSGSEKA